jgi:hypothetical protein
MEKWREKQLETLAHRFAVRIKNKGVPSGEKRKEFLQEAIQHSIESKRVIEQISLLETDALAQLMYRAVEDVMNEKVEFEDNNDTGRFVIGSHHKRAYEKRSPGKFTTFEREKEADYLDIYQRAQLVSRGLKKEEVPLEPEEFIKGVDEKKRLLKEKYPFLFDAETGAPRTAIQPVYFSPYQLTEEEIMSDSKSARAPQRYRKELFCAEEKIIQWLKKELGQRIPKGFSTPLQITNKASKEALTREGTALYLPELYHGYSLALAAEHYERYLSADFQLCDPLSGLVIAYQNLESLNRDPRLSHRIQAYHEAHRGEGRDNRAWSTVVSCGALTISMVRFNRGSSDISSGLIFNPDKNTKKG